MSVPYIRLNYIDGSDITLYSGYKITARGRAAGYTIYPEYPSCVSIGKNITRDDDRDVLSFEDDESGPTIVISVHGKTDKI